MRLLTSLALLLVGVAFVQCQLVVPQLNNLNSLIALYPKLQNFLNKLDKILPQFLGSLPSFELQSIKEQIIPIALELIGEKLDLNTIREKLRPVLQQLISHKPQTRSAFDALLNQVSNAALTDLPGIILGLLGKRDTADTSAGINDLLTLLNKPSLNTMITQIQQFVNPAQLQQLQTQLLGTIMAATQNNWNVAPFAQALQQLVSQFVPQTARLDINWDQLAQNLLNGAVTALPSVLLGIFGKRDADESRLNVNEILAIANKLPLGGIMSQIQQFLNGDKLQQLQNQLVSTVLAAVGNKWNVATLAQALQQLVSQFVPQTARLDINWDQLAQNLLNGAVSVIPSVLLGIFGKRDVRFDFQQLLSQLSIDKMAQVLEIVTSVDKSKVFAQLRKLFQQFFQSYVGRVNFDEMAAAVINNMNNLSAALSNSIFSVIG